jgi:hypothetical protein
VGLGAGLDTEVRGKILCLCGNRTQVVQYSEVKTTQYRGNYIDLYHLHHESITLCFTHRVYLWVSCDYRKKQ